MKKSDLSPRLKKLVELRGQEHLDKGGEKLDGSEQAGEDCFDGDFTWSHTLEGFDFWRTLSSCESMAEFVMTEEYKIWLTTRSQKFISKAWNVFVVVASLFAISTLVFTVVNHLIN